MSGKQVAAMGAQQPFDSKRMLLKWAPLLIVLFTAALYSSAVQNGITYFDDDYYILQNSYIRDLSLHGIKELFTTPYSSNYHPFTTLGWAIIFKLFRYSAWSYHLLNVLLHLLNTWLAFKVAERLSGQRITAIVVALLFAVHPMHVESVAWISELKDVLYTAFYLSALLLYMRWVDAGFRVPFYIGSLLLFAASLLSKSAAVTLPVLLIVVDVYRGRKINARSLPDKLPYFVLAIAFGLINLHSQGLADLSSFGAVNRVFLFTGGLAFYIVRLVAPFGLCVEHYFPLMNGHMLPWEYYASLPFLLLVTWLVVRRSAYRKELLFGMAFFLVTISVMLQLLPVGSAIVAERYTYVPYIGLFYIIGQLVTVLVAKDKWRNTTVGVFVAIVALFSVLTWQRIAVWQNSDTLFTDVVEKNPTNGNICFVLWSWGNAKDKEGKYPEAIQLYTQALTINPQFEQAYCNRGEAYSDAGDVRAALKDYDAAIKVAGTYSDDYTDRGWAYYQLGDTQQAMRDYNKAISQHTFAYKDKYAEAFNSRGWAYYGMHDTAAALSDFNEAIKRNPYFSRPYFNVAAIKAGRGDINGAIDVYDHLLAIDPENQVGYYMRGIAHYNGKDNKGACADWNKAAELGNSTAGQMLAQYCR